MRLPLLDHPVPRPVVESHFDTGPRSIAAVRVLRISITDRCNFRCLYCMPEEGVRWLPKDDILTFEEIADVVKAAIDIHGISRFKLTGGEPTVRHGLVDLVRMLRKIDGIEDLSLTTNGMLLEDLAGPLKECGLDRVTVSLDSLHPERFRRITRTGDLAVVLRGLDRCEAVGLDALKINCVTMRGTNDDEFANFARLTLARNLTVRFIEYMPLGDSALMHPSIMGVPPMSSIFKEKPGQDPHSARIADSEIGPAAGCGAQDRGQDAFISETEVRNRIEADLGPLIPVDRATEPGVGPAIPYRLALGNPAGRIGFISAMSAPFCATCNRLRLTANGVLRSCLFEGGEVEIRDLLRRHADPSTRRQALAHAMSECVRLKPDVHSQHGNQQMSRIGG
jgi:cyclic pyranopterin phosphate synthase